MLYTAGERSAGCEAWGPADCRGRSQASMAPGPSIPPETVSFISSLHKTSPEKMTLTYYYHDHDHDHDHDH